MATEIPRFTDTGSRPICRQPIWTAFVNYRIAHRHWMVSREAGKVLLRDFTRYVFAYPDEYTPQLCATGEHELCFAEQRGEFLLSFFFFFSTPFFLFFLFPFSFSFFPSSLSFFLLFFSSFNSLCYVY